MEDLNNWDNDTIKHLINKLEIDAETMENLQNHHLREARNLKAKTENKTFLEKSHEDHAHEFKGQKVAYRYMMAYLREMLADNAKAIRTHQPS